MGVKWPEIGGKLKQCMLLILCFGFCAWALRAFFPKQWTSDVAGRDGEIDRGGGGGSSGRGGRTGHYFILMVPEVRDSIKLFLRPSLLLPLGPLVWYSRKQSGQDWWLSSVASLLPGLCRTAIHLLLLPYYTVFLLQPSFLIFANSAKIIFCIAFLYKLPNYNNHNRLLRKIIIRILRQWSWRFYHKSKI